MNKRRRAHGKTAFGPLRESNESPSVTTAEKTLVQREVAVLAGEQAAGLREAAAISRENAVRIREEATEAKPEFSVDAESQLREANERLVIATVQAQTMAEAAEGTTAQMSYMAEHDFLTGLPNRSLLTDRLTQSIALAQRNGKRVALMYLDVDRFKQINDSLGHAVGDQLLQAIAKRLQACVRSSDTVCRQGGDEFVVLLPEVSLRRDAALTAEKLIAAMAEPFLIGGHRLHATLSAGLSLYPDDGKDVEALVRNADTAMYHAKKGGRNNYQMFTPEMNVRAVARRSVEVALRHALDRGEFVLHYQPKVNLETGAIYSAEALLRMRKSDRRLVYPGEFVGVAEQSGLILPIGKWVLREACRQGAAWLHAGLEFGQIAVNISPAEFHGKDFLADIRAILNDTGLDPRHLEFELTESGFMQDAEPMMMKLLDLKEIGIKTAVDDFGTGYASLNCLRRFPIDSLKIDQSFVQAIRGDTNDAIMVSAIIAMGKSLKLRVVAEGIETRLQLAFLQSQGCAEGQGHLFSRAVDAEEFGRLLGRGRH